MLIYAPRIEDLGPGDFVKVECAACGHDTLIPASALLQGLRLPPSCSISNPGSGAGSAMRGERGGFDQVGLAHDLTPYTAVLGHFVPYARI
jgi:hypothetical protein